MADPFPRKGRDLRLDFFRGLSLFFIFIDHIPNNFLGYFTLRSVAFCDAAEVFIFISGYTAALVYGRSLASTAPLFATAQIYRRVWQLYVAHIFLFVIFTAEVSYTVMAVNNPMYNEELRRRRFPARAAYRHHQGAAAAVPADIPRHPAALHRAAGAFPVVLLALERGRSAALLPSAVALRADAASRLGLPAYPAEHVWYLQSARLAVPVRHRRHRRPCTGQRALAVSTRCVAAAACRGAARHHGGHHRQLAHPLASTTRSRPLLAKQLVNYTIDKTNLAPLRLFSFLMLALATVHFVRPESALPALARRRAGHPVRPAFALRLLSRHHPRRVRPFRAGRVLWHVAHADPRSTSSVLR